VRALQVKRASGYSLVEIAVVIGVLALLVSMLHTLFQSGVGLFKRGGGQVEAANALSMALSVIRPEVLAASQAPEELWSLVDPLHIPGVDDQSQPPAQWPGSRMAVFMEEPPTLIFFGAWESGLERVTVRLDKGRQVLEVNRGDRAVKTFRIPGLTGMRAAERSISIPQGNQGLESPGSETVTLHCLRLELTAGEPGPGERRAVTHIFPPQFNRQAAGL